MIINKLKKSLINNLRRYQKKSRGNTKGKIMNVGWKNRNIGKLSADGEKMTAEETN